MRLNHMLQYYLEDPPMENDEEVISLDLEDDSLLYRLRRGHRVLYVEVKVPDIIPRNDRTESGAILKHLRLLPEWFSAWQTLTVLGSVDSPTCHLDIFQPHSLLPSDLVQDSKVYDLAEFENTERISDRVFKGNQNGNTLVVKIAQFAHELHYLRPELRAYGAFRAHDFKSMPEIYGYVFEERPDRVIGFAMEYLEGPHAGPEDLNDCRNILTLVHQFGYILGDLNRYNWVRTDAGMKVFDFEAAIPQSETETTPEDELQALPFQLSDDSGIGQR